MNFIKIQFFLSLTIIFLASSMQAQTVSGKVIDGEKYKAVPFASIAIEGTTLGTVTNFEGVFSFEIPAEYIEKQIVVSCVGFKERKFEIIDIYGNNNLEIELEAENVEIDEVVVEQKSLLPYTILKKAVHFIKDNYIAQPYNYEFYYSNKDTRRDDQVRKRESIILMSDAKGYFKTSVYKTFKEINYRFIESKRNFDVTYLDESNTNVDNLLEFDIARHPNNVLNTIRLYDFEVAIKDEISYKGELVWVLSYSSKSPDFISSGDFHANFYSGEIFISKDDYAVLYNKTTVKTGNQSKIARNLYVEPSANKLKNAFYNFEVFYKKHGDSYVLDKIDYKIDYSYKEHDDVQILSTESSLVVIKIITEKPHILDIREYYEDTVFDEAFWAGFKK